MHGVPRACLLSENDVEREPSPQRPCPTPAQAAAYGRTVEPLRRSPMRSISRMESVNDQHFRCTSRVLFLRRSIARGDYPTESMIGKALDALLDDVLAQTAGLRPEHSEARRLTRPA